LKILFEIPSQPDEPLFFKNANVLIISDSVIGIIIITGKSWEEELLRDKRAE
jgi:hypothetical protein